jgi:hypothetical protein
MARSTAAARESQAPGQPEAIADLEGVTDAMHALLIKRADELVGCTESSPEEASWRCSSDAIEAYEAQRRPLVEVSGRKRSWPMNISPNLQFGLGSKPKRTDYGHTR